MRLQGGRWLLSLKGNEERKAITSHFSSPYHTFLVFITLPLFLVLCLFALKLSFVVTLLHLLPGCFGSRPRHRPLAGLGTVHEYPTIFMFLWRRQSA